VIPLIVVFVGSHNMALRAEVNTKVTLLAKFLFYLDITFQYTSPDQFLPVIQLLSADAILRIMFRMSSIFRFNPAAAERELIIRSLLQYNGGHFIARQFTAK